MIRKYSILLKIALKQERALLHQHELERCIKKTILSQEEFWVINLSRYLLHHVKDTALTIRVLNQIDCDVARLLLSEIYQSDQYEVKNSALAIELLCDITQHATLTEDYLGKAHYNLAILYDENIETLCEHQKTFYHYQRAIEYGFSLAYHHLGYKYRFGEGIGQDLQKSAFCFKQSIRTTGNSASYFELGTCYTEGLGVNRNREKAKRLFIEAYRQGVIDAGVYLGELFCEEHRTQEALRFLKETEEKGSGHAAFDLGLLYDNGMGVQIDLARAEYYYQRAIENGVHRAYHNLAIIKIKQSQCSEDRAFSRQFLSDVLGLIQHLDFLIDKKSLKLSLILEEYENSFLAQCCNNKLETLQHKECLLLNKTILSVYTEASSPHHKIFSILKLLQGEAKDNINYATAIHRIGAILDKNAASRELVISNLNQIERLLFEIEREMEQMDNRAIISILEGLSKCFMSHSLPFMQSTFNVLCRQIMVRLECFSSHECLAIIQSLARTNTQEELNDLVNYIIGKISLESTYLDQANVLFHLAVLDHYRIKMAFSPLLEDQDAIKMMFTQLLLSDALSQHDIIFTRTLYFTLFYFVTQYEESFQSYKTRLHRVLYPVLSDLIHSEYNSDQIVISRLQQSVLRQIEKKHVCESEVYINGLSVDVVIINAQGKYTVVQVDGPSHFLFDSSGAIERTPKDHFHDFILQNSSLVQNIVHIPYYEWNELSIHHEKELYLSSKLQGIQNITSVNMPSLSSNALSFFRQPHRRRGRKKRRIRDHNSQICHKR